LNSSFKQHPDDPIAGMLRQIAVEGSNRVACLPQPARLIFRRQLGRHKNDRLLHASGRKHGVQQAVLVVEVVGVMDHFSQQGTVDPFRQFNPLGILRQTSGHRSNTSIQRGRKQQRLSVGRQASGNEVNVFDKAHIQHPIRFIQNQRHDA
jgi:hypothetical protein